MTLSCYLLNLCCSDDVANATGPVVVDIDKCAGTVLDDIVLADVEDDQCQPIVYVESVYEAGTTDRFTSAAVFSLFSAAFTCRLSKLVS